MSISSFQIRKAFTKGDRERDRGLKTPEEIQRFDNLSYGVHGKWNLLDVYRRKDSGRQKLPVIISIHGGGWVYGTKEVYQFYCMSLAKQGFVVINFNYRLAPEHRFPAQIADLNMVIEFVRSNSERYGFDTGNVFMVGDSAGGHLNALYSCMCTNPEYARKYEERFQIKVPEGFRPRAVALNCGIYDLKAAIDESSGLCSTKTMVENLLGKRRVKEEHLFITPVLHMTQSFPPTFLMTSNGDFLRNQVPFIEAKLKNLNIPYLFKMYGDESRELPHVFHCNMHDESAAVCNQDECDFFHEFL